VLYTVIMEYRGGTYLSQARVLELESITGAMQTSVNWRALHPSVGEEDVMRFLAELRSERPVVVQDLERVWCLSGRLAGALALVHIVETVASGS
jgi:hypothetical protein